METPRLTGVPREHERVVLESAHELDDVQPAVQRHVRERRLERVVSLVEEQQLGLEEVEEPLRADRVLDRRRDQLEELFADLRIADVDTASMREARDRRKRADSDRHVLEPERLDVGDGVRRLEQARGRVTGDRRIDVAHVIGNADEPIHTERREVPLRRPRRAQWDERHRCEAFGGKSAREDRLHLHLQDEVRQADDQRDAGRIGGWKPPEVAVAFQPPQVGLDRSPIARSGSDRARPSERVDHRATVAAWRRSRPGLALRVVFVSPRSRVPLEAVGDELVSATGERFPVVRGIARFVSDEGYSKSFGEQWNHWRRVQLDSVTGKSLTRERFFSGTGWPDRMDGERILEAGCGAGRFTEVLLSAGAEVWSVDASEAIDVAAENAGANEHFHAAQADLFALPFPPASFDRVFCFGVLQHTPEPRRAFLSLIEHVRPGGPIATDVYRRADYVDRWSAKWLWRPLTTRLSRDRLRRIVEWYVPQWLPIDTRLARVPKVGRFLTAVVPCWNYTGLLDLDDEELRTWAVLDTFDALSPRYDRPQTMESVRAVGRRGGPRGRRGPRTPATAS